MDVVAAIHRFNRFYFERMEPIEKARLDVGFDRTQLPVFVRLAAPHGATSGSIARALKMHPSQVSRVLQDFRAHRLFIEAPEPYDQRVKRLHLTPRGEGLRRSLDRNADAAAGAMVANLSWDECRALVTALETAAWLLGCRQVPRPTAPAKSAARSTPASG